MLTGWPIGRLASFLILGVSLLPGSAGAGLEILSHSATVDRAQRQVSFTLTFNRVPDLIGTDEFGNPHDSFQYWYDADHGDCAFSGETVSVIRGPEIRYHDDLPVRASLNPGGAEIPHAEGWGAQRGAVSFALEAATLTFSVPWTLLSEDDGKFSYRLMAFQDGSQTADVSSVLVASPSPFTGGLVIALAIAAYVAWEKIRRVVGL